MPTLQEVPITEIEKKLTELWEADTLKNKIRASLFNLIIYTHELRRTAYFKELVHTLLENFPSRIIFIEGNPDLNQPLTAEISNEPVGKGNVLIACDQITLHVGIDNIHRIPSIVLPLLLPDLPIYLLWGQDPTTEVDLLPHLEEFARRLIFDSECTKSLNQFSEKILHKMSSTRTEIVDILWAKMSGWRDVLASIFEKRDKISELQKTAFVKIFYNEIPSEFICQPKIQALYLQAWLASRLGWIFARYEDGTLYYEGIEVQLVPEENMQLPSGEILGIELTSRDHHFTQVKRQTEDPNVIVHCSTLEHCELPYALPLPDLKRGFAFMKEIFYHQTSSHYGEMLQQLAKIQWNGKN